MKYIFSLCFLLCFGLNALLFAEGPIAVLSINVRLGTAKDKENSWPNRRDFMMEIVRAGKYDFIGGQEVVVHPDGQVNQIEFMSEKLPEYGVEYRSREVVTTTGEGTPIFYRRDRWEIDDEEKGVFWLSDTPTQPGSITWEGQSQCPRNVTWGLFHEISVDRKRTGKSIYVFCSHFDHVGEIPRQKSAELIAKRIFERKHKDSPAVFMGDLNTGESSPSIRYLKGETVELNGEKRTAPQAMVDSFRAVHPGTREVATFNSFKKDPDLTLAKIDYIFLTKGLKAVDAEIIRTKNAEGRFPSDHFPIRATIEFE